VNLAPGKNFDAVLAPAPTLLNSKASLKFKKVCKLIFVGAIFAFDFVFY
jgi:hypothetical protein